MNSLLEGRIDKMGAVYTHRKYTMPSRINREIKGVLTPVLLRMDNVLKRVSPKSIVSKTNSMP